MQPIPKVLPRRLSGEEIIVRSSIIGLVGAAILGALAGLTGWGQSEYKQGPGQEAIIIAMMFAPIGFLGGVATGIVIALLRYLIHSPATKP